MEKRKTPNFTKQMTVKGVIMLLNKNKKCPSRRKVLYFKTCFHVEISHNQNLGPSCIVRSFGGKKIHFRI